MLQQKQNKLKTFPYYLIDISQAFTCIELSKVVFYCCSMESVFRFYKKA